MRGGVWRRVDSQIGTRKTGERSVCPRVLGVLPVVDDYFFLDVSVYGYAYNPVANSGVFTPLNTWAPEQHPWRMVSTLEKGFSRVTHPLDMLAVNATFFLAGGGSIVAGGAAIAGGCLEPTLAEPLTCGAGILGGVPTMAGGGFLLKQGVTFFHNYTLPAIENWGGDE